MHAIDTNVLVRLVARDDPEQTEVAEQFVEKGAWISHIVLVETIWVLESVFELPKYKLQIAIEMLIHHKNLVLQDRHVVEKALQAYIRASKVGFSDFLIREVAKQAGHVPLGTFDKALAQQPDVVGLLG